MTKKYSRRDFLTLGVLATLAVTPFGCATRPNLRGPDGVPINSNARLGKFNQNVARYHAHPVEIFGDAYYHLKVPHMGNALFKYNNSYGDTLFNVDKNGGITGTASVIPKEKGLYFFDSAKDKNGKMIDKVKIDPRHKKEINMPLTVVDRKGGLGILCETEQNHQANFEVIYLSENTPWLAIKEDRYKEGFYDFYLTPVEGTHKRTDKKTGEIEFIHEDRIYRPKYYSEEVIRQAVLSLKAKKRKETVGALKQVGFNINAIEVSDINGK
ncbi:MAG: hypothetical protein PVJ67_04700 [Candidatus Pacearchaeota archaeon]